MKIKGCLLLILIFVSAVALSVVSFVFRYQAYGEYWDESLETPVLGAVFKAAADGIFPWNYQDEEEEVTSAFDEVAANKDTGSQKIRPVKLEYTTVDDSYFDDALFIGDSRMVGLSEYCEAIDSRATFYAKKSLTIFDIRDDAWISTEEGEDITLWDALSTASYSKIYIMVGINELGTGDEKTFREAYSDVVNEIATLQPDAYIFINSIMHVSAEKNESDELYNNNNINIRNNAIRSLENRRNIFYLDINEAVDDETGNLNSEWTFDGVHLKGANYEPWHEYLLSHGILTED